MQARFPPPSHGKDFYNMGLFDNENQQESQVSTKWTQVTVTGRHADLDTIVSFMSMVTSGLQIEDYSDIELNGMYGELIDEAILNADKDTVRVSLYLPEERSLPDCMAFLRERIETLALDAEISCDGVSEEDWAESWKQYYKPILLRRLAIVPAWEHYTPTKGEKIVRMDPGMAFGTGTHETTRLVLELIEDEVAGGEHVLDVGCGSGILSLAAAALGARACKAYDIDPVAVRVTRENVKDAGCDCITCEVSDLLSAVDLSDGKFDLVLANIVADILLRMIPDLSAYVTHGARIILSGIIDASADAVRDAMIENGYTFLREKCESDWHAMLFIAP